MRPTLVLSSVVATVAALVAPAVAAPAESFVRSPVRVVALDLDRPATAPAVVADRGSHVHDPARTDLGSAPTVSSDPTWWTAADVPAGDGVMVGAEWGGTDAEVAVRARRDGTWTEWLPLEVSLDQPDGAEARDANPDTSSPVWFGHAERFQVRASDPVDLDLHVVDDVEGGGPPATAEAATTIRPRSAWGADESLRSGTPVVAASLEFGVIHHEGGTPRWTADEIADGCTDAAAAIRAIYAYHTQSHGWSDIGYNVVVDPCGGIWEGRAGGVDDNVVGAHAAGFNVGSFGVLALGTFHGPGGDLITSTMVRKLENVFAYKFSLAGIDARGTVEHTGGCSGCSSRHPAGTTVTVPRVSAHQVTSWTACPGEHLMARLFTGTGPSARPTSAFTQAVFDKTSPPPDDGGHGNVEVSRWSGSARIQTAVEVSRGSFAAADVAVLATAVAAPDGLVAGPLAASRSGPVLLTRPGGLHADVGDELRRLGVTRVDLVGGTAVIGPEVVRDLAALGITRVRRLAGVNRFQTAQRVADDVRARTGGRAVVVATGGHPDRVTAFADALTAGAYGALTLAPVVLTRPDGLPTPSRAAMTATSSVPAVNRVVVVGGRYALPSDLEADVRDAVPGSVNLSSFAGRDRYETATLALGSLVDRGLVDGSRVLMASGGNWPDGLTAGAAAASLRRPLVLVPPETGYEGSSVDLATTAWGMTSAVVVGGAKAVSDGVVAEIRGG